MIFIIAVSRVLSRISRYLTPWREVYFLPALEEEGGSIG